MVLCRMFKLNKEQIFYKLLKNMMQDQRVHARQVQHVQHVMLYYPKIFTINYKQLKIKNRIYWIQHLDYPLQVDWVAKLKLIRNSKELQLKSLKLQETYMLMVQNQTLIENFDIKIVLMCSYGLYYIQCQYKNNNILASLIINFISKKVVIMIKNKYKTLEVIKQRNGKIIQRALPNSPYDKKCYILKSYPINDSKSIQNQLEIYQIIKQPHLNGFPQIKQGFREDNRLYLVFQELGNNLEHLRKVCGGRFSLKTTLMVGLQMLQRLQYIHECGYLHGDIKPSNFIMGKTGKLKHKVYMVDFELSSPYIRKGQHIQQKSVDKFSGCFRFCSLNANRNKIPSRKDQLQSLIYCLIYFMKGQLPWMYIKANNVLQAYNLIGAIKLQKQAELLNGLPYDTFKNLLNYVQKQLKFKQKPNYSYIRKELMGLMKKNGYQFDYKHDWEYM